MCTRTWNLVWLGSGGDCLLVKLIVFHREQIIWELKNAVLDVQIISRYEWVASYPEFTELRLSVCVRVTA